MQVYFCPYVSKFGKMRTIYVKGAVDLTDINLFLAFGAGILSFVSPCCLPLYPAFLSYITGMSVGELKSENAMLQKRSMLHTLFFLIGFTVIFIAIGYTSTLIGYLFRSYHDLIRQIGAIIIIFFGFVIVGVLQPKFLMKNHQFELKNRPSGYLGSLVIGLAFAAGWTPCMGPILSAVVGLAMSNPDSAIPYMLSYTLGFSIPFFVLSFFMSKMQWIRNNTRKIMKFGGSVMIVMGIILFFNGMDYLSSFLTNYLFGGWTGF